MKIVNNIKIKDNWSEVTVLDYIQIVDISTGELSEIDKLAGVISILANMELKDVVVLDLRIFQELGKAVNFINELPTAKLQPTYIIDGITYAVNYKMNSISTQQYIDMLTLSNQSLTENIHKILSLFLVPSTVKNTIFGKRITPEKYGSYDVEEVADKILNNFTIDNAHSLMLFFCKVYESLMQRTQSYLVKELKKMIKENKNMTRIQKRNLVSSLNNGVGSKMSIESLTELVEIGMRYGSLK